MQPRETGIVREGAIGELYRGLAMLMRRRREISTETHPGLSLVAYSLLDQIGAGPDIRARDLCSLFGLDKSTVSRQIDALEAAGLVRRGGERPGRRGYRLALTPEGRASLDAAADRARQLLTQRLARWDEDDISRLAELIQRFIGEFG